jgi:hypothetical protein
MYTELIGKPEGKRTQKTYAKIGKIILKWMIGI